MLEVSCLLSSCHWYSVERALRQQAQGGRLFILQGPEHQQHIKPGPWKSAQRVLLSFVEFWFSPRLLPPCCPPHLGLRKTIDWLLSSLNSLTAHIDAPTLFSRITCRLSGGDHSRCPAVGWRGTD